MDHEETVRNARFERSTRWLMALCVLGIVFLLLNLLHFPFGRDQGIFAMVADTFFQEGAVPYRDAWDFKTPGIFLVYAVSRAFIGPSELAFRFFEILWWLAMAAGFFVISTQLIDRRAAVLSVALAVLSLMLNGFWHVGQPESFAAGIVTGALVFYLTPFQNLRTRFFAWTLGAALYTCAAILKPPLGGGILVSFAFAAVTTWQDEGFRALWRPVLAHVIGGTAILVLVGGWLVVSGAWPAFYDAVFVFAPNYSSLGHGHSSFASLLLTGVQRFVLGWPWLSVGLVLLFAMPTRSREQLVAAAHILGVIAVMLVGVALQAKFFAYHFGAIVALASLPAGWGYWLLWGRIGHRRLALPAFCMGIAVLMLLPPEGLLFWKHNAKRVYALVASDRRNELLEGLYFRVSVRNPKVAKWLSEHAPTRDAEIFVWGFEPLLYYYSGLPPHNRFIYNVPMRAAWSQTAARAEFWKAYEQSPPWAIVVQSNDDLPFVTGNDLSSRGVLDADFPELKTVLETEYVSRESVGPLEIYTRREATPASAITDQTTADGKAEDS